MMAQPAGRNEHGDLDTVVDTVLSQIKTTQPAASASDERKIGLLQEIHSFCVGREAEQSEIDAS